jgi:hypothetical protein
MTSEKYNANDTYFSVYSPVKSLLPLCNKIKTADYIMPPMTETQVFVFSFCPEVNL